MLALCPYESVKLACFKKNRETLTFHFIFAPGQDIIFYPPCDDFKGA
jgi:hypothetical protein